ncbi:MAG: adenosylcobinamide-GDP ribazoletransferase [Syntrophaceticus sp.]
MKYFFVALTFLTRMPIGRKSVYKTEDFQKSIFFFPIIGLLIGLILWGSYYLLDIIFPQQITAALLLLIYVLLTGGLHLDGLIDTVDGLFGGMTQERRLEIMKDTNPGAFGVLGAVLILIIKYSIYAQLDHGMLLFLIAAPVLGRQSMVWMQVFYPYARKEGLGKLFSAYNNFALFGVTTGITLVILFCLAQISGIYIFLLTGVFCFLLASQFARLLGGLTGDTYGAACELAEVFALLVAFAIV